MGSVEGVRVCECLDGGHDDGLGVCLCGGVMPSSLRAGAALYLYAGEALVGILPVPLHVTRVELRPVGRKVV